MAWSYPISRTTPPDTGEAASLGATRIRSLKESLIERLTAWVYSFDAADAETDYGLKKAPLRVQASAPAAEASSVMLYSKDVSAKAELFVRDEDGNEIQITSGGAINVSVPAAESTGVIKMFGSGTAPTGYLLCNGAAVSRSTYSALFALVGTTYGSGDGASTFNVPDLRDRFPVGAGSTYANGGTGGEATHTLIEAEMPSHTHSSNAVSNGGGGDAPGGPYMANTGGVTIANTGGGGAHNNLPPYIGVYFIIKT